MKTSNQISDMKAAPEGRLEIVLRQVESLEFGVVQIVVHASRVVQIERTEKVRMPNSIAIPGTPD